MKAWMFAAVCLVLAACVAEIDDFAAEVDGSTAEVDVAYAPLAATPTYLYTASQIELGATESAAWPLRSASGRWDFVSRPTPATAKYKSQFFYGTVGMRVPAGTKCPGGNYLGGSVTCTKESDGTNPKRFACPHGRVPKPLAFGFGSSPPIYGQFDAKHSYAPVSVAPHHLGSEYYESSPGVKRQMLVCYYELPFVTISTWRAPAPGAF